MCYHQYNILQYTLPPIQYIDIVEVANIAIYCPIYLGFLLPTVGFNASDRMKVMYNILYNIFVLSRVNNTIIGIVELSNTIYCYCWTDQYNILVTIYCNIL